MAGGSVERVVLVKDRLVASVGREHDVDDLLHLAVNGDFSWIAKPNHNRLTIDDQGWPTLADGCYRLFRLFLAD